MAIILYKLTFKQYATQELYTEIIVSGSLKQARHEGRSIATMKSGVTFIKANKHNQPHYITQFKNLLDASSKIRRKQNDTNIR